MNGNRQNTTNTSFCNEVSSNGSVSSWFVTNNSSGTCWTIFFVIYAPPDKSWKIINSGSLIPSGTWTFQTLRFAAAGTHCQQRATREQSKVKTVDVIYSFPYLVTLPCPCIPFLFRNIHEIGDIRYELFPCYGPTHCVRHRAQLSALHSVPRHRTWDNPCPQNLCNWFVTAVK